MKRDDDHMDPRRRRFLKAAGLAGAGAGAAVALPAVLGGDEAEAYQPPAEQSKAQYSETDHVKRFYALNRL